MTTTVTHFVTADVEGPSRITIKTADPSLYEHFLRRPGARLVIEGRCWFMEGFDSYVLRDPPFPNKFEGVIRLYGGEPAKERPIIAEETPYQG